MKKRSISYEIDINIPDNGDFKKTSLMQAVLAVKETHVISKLLEKKADVNAKDNNGKTAITLALELLNFETASPFIRILIEAKGDVNETNCGGFTLLMLSILYNQSSLTAVLLQNGADVNMPVTDGARFSALQCACRLKPFKWQTKFDVIKSLLLAGADKEGCLNLEENQIKTEIQIFIESEIKQLLIVKGILMDVLSTPAACNLIIMTYVSPFIKLNPEFTTTPPIADRRDSRMSISHMLSRDRFLTTIPRERAHSLRKTFHV